MCEFYEAEANFEESTIEKEENIIQTMDSEQNFAAYIDKMITEIDEVIEKKNVGWDVSDKVEKLEHLTSLVVSMNDHFLRSKKRQELERKRREEFGDREITEHRLNKLLKSDKIPFYFLIRLHTVKPR